MSRQFKIKDIARQAGVSAGTVDRVLHNRGRVSERSRQAVEEVLNQVGYKTNIHTSAVSTRKEFSLAVTIPSFSAGEYWSSIKSGIDSAMAEFSDVKLTCSYIPYNQFDIYSCRASFDAVRGGGFDAAVIAPTFKEETLALCKDLDGDGVPYVFVDTDIEDANPWATFTADQPRCGFLMGRLLSISVPPGNDIAIIGSRRIGKTPSLNSAERERSLVEFLSGMDYTIRRTEYSPYDPELNSREIMKFLQEYPRIGGIAVLNSRGYVVGDILGANGVKGIKLFSFDMTVNNVRCLREGSITALLCQSPERQGFEAVKALISRLLYNRPEDSVREKMPIDVIFPENLAFYK